MGILDEEHSRSGSGSQRQDTLKDLLRIVIFAVVLFLPFLQDRAEYQSSVEREIVANQTMMTSFGVEVVQGSAAKIYNTIMSDMGVYGFLQKALKNDKAPTDKFAAFWAKFLIVSDRIVDNLPLLVYQIGYRLGVMIYWLIYLCPFLMAAVYSGAQTWRLARIEMAGVKIQRFKIYRQMHRITALFVILFLFIPSAGAAEFAKFFMPIAIVIASAMFNKMLGAYHQLV